MAANSVFAWDRSSGRWEFTMVIVIGASGYIGRQLVHAYRGRQYVYATSSSYKQGLSYFNLDDPGSFDYSLIAPESTIFLMAAISAPDICARDFDKAWAINVTGTSAFVAAALARGARVIFFSSDAVYGNVEDHVDEASACNPIGEYGSMKREVELRFAGHPGFKALRLSYVFSLEDKFTNYLMGCAIRGEEADVFHPFYRAIVHRDDVISGALAVAELWDQIPEQFINFGGPQILSRLEFTECLSTVHLNGLQFRASPPSPDFFRSRAQVIAMASPVFARLLGRPPRSLSEAASIEFFQV